MKKENIFETVIGIIIWVYMIVSQIMTLVFFIGYCKKDSIFEIIFVDSWLSEIKGLLWILFIW